MKKICVLFLAMILLLSCWSTVAFAVAPDAITPGVTGNTSDLINVTRPENQKDSTFDNSYIVSGYGMAGTVVNIYRFDDAEQVYKKLYKTETFVDENGVKKTTYSVNQIEVGTSGIYTYTVDQLDRSENRYLLRAENGDKVQYIKLEITKYEYNIIDLIKSMAA